MHRRGVWFEDRPKSSRAGTRPDVLLTSRGLTRIASFITDENVHELVERDGDQCSYVDSPAPPAKARIAA